MKNYFVLIFLSFLILHFNCNSDKTPARISINTEDNKIDTILIDTITKKDTIAERQPYPWSSDHPCDLTAYDIEGLFPAMRDSLVALSLEERLTNGLNRSEARSNYHGVDFTLEGVDYSAAIDISVRCLEEDEIRDLLDELSMKGFAGWYRKKGEDGWKGINHIHAVWVAAPLKRQLKDQIKNWLAGRNC